MAEVETQTVDAPSETVTTTETTPAAFDPATLPPEYVPHFEASKKYFEAQQQKALSEMEEKYKPLEEKAKGFDSLTADPRFQQWRNGLNGPQQTETPKPKKSLFEDMPDEDYLAIINDKKKFGNLLEQVIEERAAEKLGPRVDRVAEEAQRMRLETEIEKFASKHTDFWDPKVNKSFNEVATRFNGQISIEDAYWLAKRQDLEKEALEKAHLRADEKRQASLEKPGVSSARSTGAPIKVRDVTEAMQIALEYKKAGRAEPEFIFE